MGCSGWIQRRQVVDSLAVQQIEHSKALQELKVSLELVEKELDQIKQVLPRLVNVMELQKGTLERLEGQIKQVRQVLSSDQERS